MNKQDILHKIRNRLTLPMTVLEVVREAGSNCEKAMAQIKAMIKEIENETSHE